MNTAYPNVEGVTYKTLIQFPNYCVGDDGSVWTLNPRRIAKGSIVSNGCLYKKPTKDKDGYCSVGLVDRFAKRFCRRVSVLVLEAFVGPKPPGMEACHFPDRDVSNNRLDNLSWGTRKKNAEHRKIHGMTVRGERINTAKLKPHDVIELRALRKEGWTIPRLVKRFGICKCQVSKIALRQSWKHI